MKRSPFQNLLPGPGNSLCVISKTYFAGIVVIASVSWSFGQGLVNFRNNSTRLTSTNSVSGEPATGLMSGPVNSYYFALFSAPTTQTTVDSSLTGRAFTGCAFLFLR